MTDAPPPAPVPPPAEAYQDRDINLRAVLGFGVALVLLAVVSQVVLAWWFFSLRHREESEKQSHFPLSATKVLKEQTDLGTPVTGALPSNEPLEHLNLQHAGPTAAAENERAEKELNGHGTPGNPHIPIDEAMRLVAEGYTPQDGQAPPIRYDAGIPGTGGGSNSGRDIPEGKR